MKVLLLEHPRGRSNRHFNDVAHTPLSSSLMSAYLFSSLREQGIETELCDFHATNRSLSRMVKTVNERECDVLGVHLVYSWENTQNILRALHEIGSRYKLPIIVYGFYPTFAYKTLLELYPSITYVIRGEPEYTFFKLCSVLKKGTDPGLVKGIAFRRDKALVVTERPRPIDDLDALPVPYRTEEQRALTQDGINVLGSRGCYGSCSFCYINNFYGVKGSWRGRTPANIYEEVTMIAVVPPEQYIYFVDANFFGPGTGGQERAVQIAEHLKTVKGFTFGLECRVNDVREASLKHLVDAGLRNVFLGVESASPSCLKRIKKNTTVQQTHRALALLRGYGIEPHIGFIMFEPDSELHDIRLNFNFLMSQNLLNGLSKTVDLLYHPEIILMGTDNYRLLESAGRIELSSHSDYQGSYSFKDRRVKWFADTISPVCHYLLELMDKADSPLYWRNYRSGYTTADHLREDLTAWLAELFEKLLVRLETDDVPCTDQVKDRTVGDAIEAINTIITKTMDDKPATEYGGLKR